MERRQNIRQGIAHVMQQVPTIRDLNGMWYGFGRGFCIQACSITADDLCAWVMANPVFCAYFAPFWQQVDHLALFQITENRAIELAFAPCPFINTQNARTAISDKQALMAEFAQKGITTGNNSKLTSQSRSTFSAKRHGYLPDRLAQTTCAPRITQHRMWKTFSKDRLFAVICLAEESPHMKLNMDRNAFPREVAQVPMASRTKTLPGCCSQHQEKLAICEGLYTLNGYLFTIGNQR